MKRTLFFIACVLASVTMSAQEELAVDNIQNSGCLSQTRGEIPEEPVPTIVLTKENSILSVQVLNYESNCATEGFNVKNSMSEGINGVPTLTIEVTPYREGSPAQCVCPFNVSFTLRDLETNTFYLKCWWYEGPVTLEEGKPLVLEDITLNATIEGVKYELKKTLGTAALTKVVEQKSKMVIPSELYYEGDTYKVKSIYRAFVNCTTIKTLDIPESVSTIFNYSFGGCKLDTLIIRGVLESRYINSALLYGLGTDMKVFVQPSEVEKYKAIYNGPVYSLPEQTFDDVSYRPLVEEGKHWTYDNFMPLRPAEYDHYYYYDLRGDTLIAGKNCLKMYSENEYNDSIIRYKGALYEEGKKVYCFYPNKDEAILLYDFDCEVGDTLTLQVHYPHNYQVLVKDIQTEDNGGIPIKKYTLQIIWDYEEEYVLWIEGVGAMLDFFGMIPAAGNYNSLKACELNGETLYQWIEPDYTAKGYHKMGIEGKRWNYIHYYLDADGEHREPYSYVVKGDTIIRRTTYKKLWYQDEKTERLVCLLNEHGREVMKSLDFGDNSYDMPLMKSFFAFDREDFGRVFTWKAQYYSGNTNWMVYGVDTIEVKGQPFRRYTCLQKYSEEGETLTTIDYDGEGVWHDIWVEGVGSASSGIEDQIPSHEPPVRTPGEYTYFVSCYEDGECIFTADDFNELTNPNPADNIAYRPFVEDGKVWKLGVTWSDNPVQWVEHFYFAGDTIIDGRTCKQMMCQRYVSPDYPYYYNSQSPSLSYVGAWYEEDKKVYEYDAMSQQFKLMYDFSLDGNDTIQIDNNPYLYVIGPRQTGGINGFKGVYRKVSQLADGEKIYQCAPWLEGVGIIYGHPATNVFNVELADPSRFLMSCTVGDEVIYLNDEYEDGATPEALNARKRIDFTHTIKTKPKMPRRRMGARASSPAEEGQSLYGEYSNLKLDINLNPLADAYVVRITDETGKAVYEKSVNAASIVGLNIDISAYAAGRYTVTVENSQESFTGVFEVQTTGISDAERLNDNGEMINSHIYNLQGQRISSPQKGLNIVNGQKVFVK